MPDVITDGLKHDGGKPRLDLVPAEIIEAVGAVMTHGVQRNTANTATARLTPSVTERR